MKMQIESHQWPTSTNLYKKLAIKNKTTAMKSSKLASSVWLESRWKKWESQRTISRTSSPNRKLPPSIVTGSKLRLQELSQPKMVNQQKMKLWLMSLIMVPCLFQMTKILKKPTKRPLTKLLSTWKHNRTEDSISSLRKNLAQKFGKRTSSSRSVPLRPSKCGISRPRPRLRKLTRSANFRKLIKRMLSCHCKLV